MYPDVDKTHKFINTLNTPIFPRHPGVTDIAISMGSHQAFGYEPNP